MAKKKKKKRLSKKALRKLLMSTFHENPRRPMNYKQLANILDISDQGKKIMVNDILQELKEQEKLEEVKPGKFKLKEKGAVITGTLQLSNKGFGFIQTDEVQDDVLIRPEHLQHALDGDTVKVYIFAHRKGPRVYGEIMEILERQRTHFVGTIEKSKNYAFLIPESKRMPYDIFIPLNQLNKANNNQKAIVEITDWPNDAKNPIGRVSEVLGNQGDNEAEMHAILAEFDLPYTFEDEVVQEAERIPEAISDKEIKRRKDFRDTTTFTIDPADAKDFDDALSYRKLNNGHVEIGIHIADVSHYVQPKTILDKEAYDRGTSVYLVDRVVPMLPERLSNLICSLRPREDKLCFSAVFELDAAGTVFNEWFGRTIINSDRRFTYEQAQDIIEQEDGEFATELSEMNKIAQVMRKSRFSTGSISFERIEVKFNLDEKGAPTGVYFKKAQEANQLIEEYMLLANRKVAEFVATQKKGPASTFVYRVHDEPDEEKLKSFNTFIKKFGYRIKMNSSKQTADSMNLLFQEVEGRAEQNVIEQLAIQSMAKAEYATENIGHYGLGFDYYTHFTSPIRRYPDMMVHRILGEYLKGNPEKDEQGYAKACKHASDREKLAIMAERSSIKYKQIEYMQDKLGKQYSGIISGVTEWGLYVELDENKVEGMVSMREMDDDFYVFDDKNYRIMGRHTGKKYMLGDAVEVEVVSANLRKKHLDFRFVPDENEEKLVF